MCSPQRSKPFEPPPCIIVPVFNALSETKRCLRSVLHETRPPFRILVLNDASTDEEVAPTLNALAQSTPHLQVYTQERNVGFAANVNTGLKMSHGDVVLLNSDTVVTANWLDKLVATAYSRPNVATVTPVSNAAGAFSVPDNNVTNELPSGASENTIARISALVAAPLPIEAPTGNGFCLYIRRSALERIGVLDADTFSHIGEENDFCQRAILAGYLNLVDTSCYIYHVRSASFASEQLRSQKLKAARRELDIRYPDYSAHVRTFLSSPELGAFRARLRSALKCPNIAHNEGKVRVLSIVHAGDGGMVHTNWDLMRALPPEFDAYVLRCDLRTWELLSVHDNTTIANWDFTIPWRSMEAPDVRRRCALRSIVYLLRADLVHLRTLISTGPEILGAIGGTRARTLVSFHDFATVCPTIQLIDDKLQFCGGYCTPGNGDCRVAKRWFSDVKDLKHSGVYMWRQRMAASLPLADAFVTTSESTKALVAEHFPMLSMRRFHVIEHGRDAPNIPSVAKPPTRPLKIVSFGAFNISKGIELMRTIFALNVRYGATIEFHVLGPLYASGSFDMPHVIYHGPYERDSLPALLQEIAPSYAMICSIWPETYCHTLTEAWLSGLPVIASDIGVLSERIGRHGGGRLIDPRRPDLWLETMATLASEKVWTSLCDEVAAIRLPSTQDMADAYAHLYVDLLD